ncbi:glycosyltransferase family 4 protein [Spirosoma taeanense]|uniref:Glycosyltransferase family 4 protein n=1 Tax=Spirosoma taeanense TaxID=2735870 RepID=A0A6M5Y5P5_9BACT|nr:glycosyltransferase family 1 protein [Spirosoma taeanense]QJW88784.1 glycosyltransferase family 4 protein [Spirosoma taeanense]
MNIILDASPLGIGFYHRKAQTGVSRVAEELLKGLWQASDIDLSLAASTHLPETMRYVRQAFNGSMPPFVNTAGGRLSARLENALLGPFEAGSLPSKAIRQVAYRTRKAFNREQGRFRVTQFPEGAIYHSPFFSIPKSVRQIPTVQTIHDLIPILHPEWFPAGEQTVRQVIEALPPTAWVTTVSQATKDDFCQYTGFDPARVVPIHLAASPTLFHPVADEVQKQAIRQQYGIGETPYLLSLATFEPRKNTDHLIRCFVKLAKSGEIPADVKLVLVGTKGWKFDRIVDELSRHDTLRSRLVVTGFVPDEHLAPLYAGALGFVYPSLYEGFGLPPLEAMQCGLPVIVSDIPASAEVVGDAAIRVPPTDVNALCQAMLTLIQSSSLRANLSAKAIARASQFSWAKFIQRHIELYKTIAEQA